MDKIMGPYGLESTSEEAKGDHLEVTSGYFPASSDRVREITGVMCNLLDREKVDFDTIVVRGISGLLIGSPLAIMMRKNLLVVRKRDTEYSHGTYIAEGRLGTRWIFVDDFISTGETLQHCCDVVRDISRGNWRGIVDDQFDRLKKSNMVPEAWKIKTKFVGVCLYRRFGNPTFDSAKKVERDFHISPRTGD